MLNPENHSFERMMAPILARIPRGANSQLEEFTRQFFAKMPALDIESLSAEHALAITTECLAFLEKRGGPRPKIRIETPEKARYGWKTQRTVIHIVNDDMPFIVDSVAAELARHNLTVYQTMHPIMRVKREDSGTLLSIAPSAAEAASFRAESLMHIETSLLPSGLTPEQLEKDLQHVLERVRLAVEDWQKIVVHAGESIEQMNSLKGPFSAEEVTEVREFLEWLRDRNFIFLGYIEYDFLDSKGKEAFRVVPGSELGVLKDEDEGALPRGLEALPAEVRHSALEPKLIEITKSNRKSSVHRPVHMDYIGLKRFDAKGRVTGERRFLGMFTSVVYHQSAEQIPIIRCKIAYVLDRAGFAPISHDGKALKAILEFYPRDEVLQLSEDQLYDFALRILSLEARPAVGLLVRQDAFQRFLSCMVFVPRERFSTYVREQAQHILETAFGGTVTDFYTQMTDSPLARVHCIVKVEPGKIPIVDPKAIEEQITRVTYLWSESLLEEINTHFGEARAEELYGEYHAAFPRTYMNLYGAGNAVHDIEKIDLARRNKSLALELFSKEGEDPSSVHLKIYSPDSQIPLSDILPRLEHMGFKVIEENPFLVTPQSAGAAERIWIMDFQLRAASGNPIDLSKTKALLEESLAAIWRRDIEDDGFNALALNAALSPRDILILRAYAKYMRQAGFPYSQNYIEQALVTHPKLASLLVDFFHARLDPVTRHENASRQQEVEKAIDAGLADVTNLMEDRIIRRYADLIRATLRTNFFQKAAGGGAKPYFSFKLASAQVPELPLPRPWAEIYVYSVRTEGIHLRGGKVARGGLRWSDRPEDFRTEILGLMKAQMVKNAVIVPVGSKGGFVLKRPPAGGSREALMEEGIACYKTLLRGLLDITDNIVKGAIVPPPDVVRHDGDDPYLVVAADKGTASFSDIANGVSKEYGFWLDDAFASGGSAGYDHKKMGITAKGAWISVVRHFREMGVDIEQSDFTVAGIGDMSGDVFGNGMLLSKRIKLVGAFNHMHIFLDPAPDAAKSFAERQRLFDLPRSTWADYNTKLISKGGGVFERSAKSIPVSKEMRAVLGTTAEAMAPDELIRALLKAPVDLLWNGGIGTYVKAEPESHEQVGDRTNNGVRINGKELRCKVVGEGGNLGFTQLGRIEYAQAGGRINTDAIDNSAGVDCSDHEVNIKIALTAAIAGGKLTLEKRDMLLVSMTEEVAALVLKDNRLQTQAISIAELQGTRLLDPQMRLVHALERDKLLDRAVEFLPSDKALAERRLGGAGLTRPELAVLLAYSKMWLYQHLLDSQLPDDAYFSRDLRRYFPTEMQKGYAPEIESHPLRREIVATAVTNSIVNRAGITFVQGVAEDTGIHTYQVAGAYIIARDAFGLRDLWMDIEALGPEVTALSRVQMFADINRLVEHVTLWLIRHYALPLAVEPTVRTLSAGVKECIAAFDAILSPSARAAFEDKRTQLAERKVPPELASRVAGLDALASACDIIYVAEHSQLDVATAGKVYFELGERLMLGWLRRTAAGLPYDSHWERLAILSVVHDFYEEQRRLTLAVASELCGDTSCSTGVDEWSERHGEEMTRYKRFIDDLRASATLTLPMLMVAARQAKLLAGASADEEAA